MEKNGKDKRALITGVSGLDGTYFADWLLKWYMDYLVSLSWVKIEVESTLPGSVWWRWRF